MLRAGQPIAGGLQAQSVNTVHFRAPIDRMLKRLVDKGLAKFRKDGTIRGTAYFRYDFILGFIDPT